MSTYRNKETGEVLKGEPTSRGVLLYRPFKNTWWPQQEFDDRFEPVQQPQLGSQ